MSDGNAEVTFFFFFYTIHNLLCGYVKILISLFKKKKSLSIFIFGYYLNRVLLFIERIKIMIIQSCSLYAYLNQTNFHNIFKVSKAETETETEPDSSERDRYIK